MVRRNDFTLARHDRFRSSRRRRAVRLHDDEECRFARHFSSKPSASAAFITALQGGIVGRSGVSLTDSDKQRALEAEYRALEGAAVGQPVLWTGKDVTGKVVAAAPYQVGSQNCRQYTHTLTVDGKDTVARGAACRNDDGSWSPL